MHIIIIIGSTALGVSWPPLICPSLCFNYTISKYYCWLTCKKKRKEFSLVFLAFWTSSINTFSKMDAMRRGDKETGHTNCNVPSTAASIMERNLWAYKRYRMFKYLAAISHYLGGSSPLCL